MNNIGTFSVEGILRYNPNREKLKKTRSHDEFFLILEVPKNLGLYYRYWVKKRYDLFLNPPAYGEHVTILDGRREVSSNYIHYWKKYNNKKVKIQYTNDVYQKWKFWCLPVISQELTDIQFELGFTENKPLHITFGRMN